MRPVAVRWALDAQAHIASIHDYIAERNPQAAQRVVARIRAAVDRLADFPYLGRPGIAPETRELMVARLPYIVVYQLDPNTEAVHILAVFHGAQDRRPNPDE
jgi:toxin ParE1/3/4